MKTYIRIKSEDQSDRDAQLTLDYSADLKPGDKVLLARPDGFVKVLYMVPQDKIREVIRHGT